MARTVLRVKRRKDDPKPPSFFKIQPQPASRKRSRHDDKETKALTSMLGQSSFLNTRVQGEEGSSNLPSPAKKRGIVESKPIVFRRVETHTDRHSHKRKSHPEDHVNVVDAVFDLDGIRTTSEKQETEEKYHSKRPRISLQMMESRIMLEKEFWQQHVAKEKKKKERKIEPQSQELNESMPLGKSGLRARMRRTASGVSAASSQNSTSRKKSSRILDPLTKLIDDSLCSIHTNSNQQTESILQHLQLLQAHVQSMNFTKLINWQCNGGLGTILHLCALSNSVQGTQILCKLFSQAIDFSCRDGDTQTAIMVARRIGASGVVEVIKAYWNEKQENRDQYLNGNKDNDEDFVYDVYCLDEHAHQNGDDVSTKTNHPRPHPKHHDSCTPKNDEVLSAEMLSEIDSSSTIDTPHNSSSLKGSNDASMTTQLTAENMNDDGSIPTVVSMRGGCGYWMDGELILDVHADSDLDDSDIDDEEYDSNREDCDANDYPDDIDGSDDNGHHNSFNDRETRLPSSRFSDRDSNLDSDSDESEIDIIDFRNRPVDLGHLKIGGSTHGFAANNDDADREDDGEYRGFMYTDSARWSNENFETIAYDPELDGEKSD